MKKNLLFTLAIILTSVACFAQNIITIDSIVKIDTAGAKYPLILKLDPTDKSAKPNLSKRTTMWLETGDGFFTTNPFLQWPNLKAQVHSPIVHFTKIYDTTKYPPPTAIKGSIKPKAVIDNSFTYSDFYENILNEKKVKIIPNNYEIVPGDPMVFAIAYNTFSKDIVGEPVLNDSVYKLYFFYNNNRTFNALNKSSSFKVEGIAEMINSCRVHNEEIISYNSGLANSKIKEDFENYICFTINKKLQESKVIFISLNSFTDLEIGKSGSVYAVLTNSKGDIIDTDIVANMPFAPAHDPNYLLQRPKCLKFEKKAYPFNYKVHFQNTGAGNAVEVKTVIQLPKGLNWSTFKIEKAMFAGADYTRVMKLNKNVFLDTIKCVLTAFFYNNAISGQTHYLRGTADTSHLSMYEGNEDLRVLKEEKTTGEILFSFQSTPNTDDSLKAYANIYFRSQYPSKNTIEGYELPVKTNTAITVYKKCCTCDEQEPTPLSPLPGCYIILGLCWWWWILIILAMLVIWYVYSRNKRKNEKDAYLNQ